MQLTSSSSTPSLTDFVLITNLRFFVSIESWSNKKDLKKLHLTKFRYIAFKSPLEAVDKQLQRTSSGQSWLQNCFYVAGTQKRLHQKTYMKNSNFLKNDIFFPKNHCGKSHLHTKNFKICSNFFFPSDYFDKHINMLVWGSTNTLL